MKKFLPSALSHVAGRPSLNAKPVHSPKTTLAIISPGVVTGLLVGVMLLLLPTGSFDAPGNSIVSGKNSGLTLSALDFLAMYDNLNSSEMMQPIMMLGAGNIMFTHVNSHDPEGWSFVTTTSIASGTIIFVTDNEWSGSAFDADGSDEVYTITFTSAIPCGSEFTFTEGAAPVSNNGSTATINDNTFFDLEAAGDALYLFDGSIGTPNFISAIKFANGAWGNGGHNLPATLTNNSTAIDFALDNGGYNCGTGSLSTTVMNEANWTTNDLVITHSRCFWSCAATTLIAGDILFTHVNSDAPDGWSFVLTKPVSTGKVIYVSENEWNGISFNTDEEIFTITFTSAAPCGTEFAFQTGNAPTSNNGSTATINDNTASFETTGEALYLIEPSLSGVHFISAISFGTGAWGINGSLPSGLTNGTNAIDFTSDNGEYNCANGTTCDAGISVFTSGIMNDANWATSGAIPVALNSFCTWTGCTVPVCTSPISPANGAVNISIATVLNWTASECASAYKIYFGTNNPPTNIVNGTNVGNVLSYDPAGLLLPNTTYYWSVVPTNDIGDAVGCSITSFITNNGIPECTTPVFPPDAAQGLPITSFNLTWADAPTATSYVLYFGTNFPPTNIVNGVNQGDVTIHATGALVNNTTYYWRIEPVDAYGTATGCSNWSFTTTISPLTFCLNCDGFGSACATPATMNNPDFSASCAGFTIVFVLDESGSVQGFQSDVENATMNFLNSLSCTGASVAMIELNGQARFLVDDYTPVDDIYVAAAQSYFNDIPVAFMDNEIYEPTAYITDLQGTNWQAGMLAVDAIAFTPDLIIFVTDGVPTGYSTGSNPTYNGAYDYCGDGTTTQAPEIVNPIKISNKLKVEGAHMFMVGVGSATLSTLQQMSGTTEFVVGNNNIGNSDYATSNFNDLAEGLAAVVHNLCPFDAEVGSQDICIGGTNGSISILVPSALFPFNYQYFDNNTNTLLGGEIFVSMSPLEISGLAVGSYRIEVEVEVPGSNCTRTEFFFEDIVANAPNVVSSIASITQPTCANPNGGSASLSITGTPSFTITLKKAGVIQIGYPVVTNTSPYTATGLNFGSYTFETQDDNSCNTDIDAFTLNAPTNCCVPTCPVNVTVQCGSSTAPAQTGSPTNTANCGTISFSDNTTGGTCPVVQVITRTWSSSISGVICTQTITVMDNTPPVITPGTIAACYPTVAAAQSAALAATSATDNCGGTIIEGVSTVGTCTAVVTVTETDACGNVSSTAYNTRIDNTPPVITPGIIATCYPTIAAAQTAALAAASATDNCPGVIIEAVSTVGTCTAVVTVTETDACGNVSSTAYNTRIDNTPPVITPGTIATCYPTVAAAQTAALAAASATDNCPGVIIEAASTVGTCTAVVTVTETDVCGNVSSTTYNTRIDNTPPVVTTGTIEACYSTVTAAQTAALTATSATDNCTGTIIEGVSTVGTCTAVVTVTETDACGNVSSTTYNTRIDNTPPVITPGTIASCYPTVEAAQTAALAAASATDNCPGTIIEAVSTVGTCTAVVTVTETDACGNVSSTTYNTRIDNTPPVITPGTIATCYPTVAAAQTAALAAASATDNCPGTIIEAVSTVGTCTAVVTVTETDACGNVSSTAYTTRIDNTAPVITTGTIAICYPTVAAAEAAAISATTATDNCPGVLTEAASTVGTCTAVVTVTETDLCGNVSSTTYNTRIDNTAPVITTGTIAACYTTVAAAKAAALAATSATDNCPGVIVEAVVSEGCIAVVTVTETDVCGNQSSTTYNTRTDNIAPVITTGSIAPCYPTIAAAEAAALATTVATDNCTGALIYAASTTGTCSAIVTVTATDQCGNLSSTTYNTRIDNLDPVFAGCPVTPINLGCNPSLPSSASAIVAAGSVSDACGPLASVTASAPTPTETNCAYSQTWTVVALDACGNDATCLVTFTWTIDTEAPVCTTKNITVSVDPLTGSVTIVASQVDNSSTDNCSLANLNVSPATFTCADAGPNVVTLTLTDGCGNTSSCTATVFVQGCTPAWTLTKTSTTMPTNNYDMVGDILTYTLALVNTGDVSISMVSLTDPLATTGPIYQSGDTDTDNMLDVGETWLYAATHTVTQGDIDGGSFTNTATATGTPASGSLPPAMDSENIPAIQNPNWVLIKSSTLLPNNYDMPGDVITYLITLQNTGNVSIITISIADPQATTGPLYFSGDTDLDLILDVGETWSYNATHTVVQNDVNAGFFTNTATATGTPSGGILPPALDDETVLALQTPGISVLKTGSPNFGGDGIPQAGETISYAFEVTNTGNVSLTNVTVTDPLVTVNGGPIASLAPGAVDNSTFTATYILSQADINAGTFTNTATATGTPPSGPDVTDTDDDTQPLSQLPSIAVLKTGTLDLTVVPPNGIPNPGDQITYVFTVTNTGNVTLTNVTITDPLVTLSGGPIASLVPGASDVLTFTAIYTLLQSNIDAGTFTNIATAAGTPPTGPNVTDTDDDTKPLNAHPSIELLKIGTLDNDVVAPLGISNAGDQITYVFTVTNAGNVTLTNVTISDPSLAVIGGPILSLAPGAMDNTTFTGTHVLTQVEIDALTFTNIATVTGTPPFGPNVGDTDDDTQPLNPIGAIEIIKQGTPDFGVDGIPQAGEIISYAFTITNTGTETLTNVFVTDPLVTVMGGPIPSMLPGAIDMVTFTATYTLLQADIDSHSFNNIATVTGTPPIGPPVTDTDDDTQTLPDMTGIHLLKTGTYVDNAPLGIYNADDQITYTFTVTNTGNVTLANVTVTDPLVTVTGVPIASLAPGASDNTTFTATYTLLQSDINAGTFTNIATATGTPPSGLDVTDPDNDTQNFIQSASINLVKTGTYVDNAPIGVYNAGDQISYTFVVTNTGNVTLTSITVTDPLVTLSGGPIPLLAPGASDNTTFTASYTLLQLDIDAGTFTNIATVTALTPIGINVDDTDDDLQNFIQTPDINVVKTSTTVPNNYDAVGDVLSYNIILANTGNLTIYNPNMSDPGADAPGPQYVSGDTDNDNVLDVGETWSYTAVHTVTQQNLDNGSYNNVATGTGSADTDGNGIGDTQVMDNDPETINALQNPGINVVKTSTTVPNNYNEVGDVLTYIITMTNNGNVTVFNPTMSDPGADAAPLYVSGDAVVIGVLEVGETWTYSASHTVIQQDLDNGSYNNVATGNGLADTDGNGTGDAPVTDNDPETINAVQNPNIHVLKTSTTFPNNYDAVGDVLTYSITLTNNGNVTVFNPTMSDPGADAPPLYVSGDGGVIGVLEVGETWTYSASYTVTQQDLDNGSYNNIATGNGEADTDGNGIGDTPVTDADPEIINVVQNPSINVVKISTTVPNNYDAAGDVLTYSITLTNNGNITVYNPTMNDPGADAAPLYISGDGVVIGVLEVGETWTYTASYTATQLDLDNGTYNNVATGNGSADTDGNGIGDTPVTDNDPETINAVQTPDINVVKTSTMIPNSYDAVGDILTYSITLTNNGNVTVYMPTMSDPGADAAPLYISGDGVAIGVLEVGETWTYTASHTVTQQDLDNGSYNNVATGNGAADTDGDDIGDVPVTDNDPETINAVQNPGIDVLKTSTTVPNNYDALGDVLTYSITLTNNGNVTVYMPTMSDPGADATPLYISGDGGAIGVLEVGETWTYAASHTITQQDLDNGTYDNVATGNGSADTDGNGIGDTPVTDNDPETINAVQTPDINVVKTSTTIPNSYDAVGDVLTYNITLTNNGNITVYNPTMSDPGADAAPLYISGDAGDIGVLEVGETWTYAASHTVTQQDLDNGSYDNVATGNGSADTDGNGIGDTPVTDNDPETINAVQTPDINVVKTSTTIPNSYDAVGDVLTYSITLTNSGNVTVYMPTMSDPGADVSPLYISGDGVVIGVLEVGETWTYTASHTVTQQDLDNGSYDNVATGNGSADTDGNGIGDTPVTDNDPETINAVQTPDINVVKTSTTIPNNYDAVGDVLTYSITLTNSGNVTVYMPTMNDPGADVPPLYISGDGVVIGVLEVGETWTYTASHTVTQQDLDIGTYDNVATGNGSADTDGDDIGDTPVTDNDPETINAVQEPGINVVKTSTTMPNIYDQVGDVLTYAITLTNTGNITVYNPTMSDPGADIIPGVLRGADQIGDNDAILDIGEIWTYVAQHTVTLADLQAGSYMNTATGTGSGDTNGNGMGGDIEDTPLMDTDDEDILACYIFPLCDATDSNVECDDNSMIDDVTQWDQANLATLLNCLVSTDPATLHSDFATAAFSPGCSDQTGSLSIKYWAQNSCGYVTDTVTATIAIMDTTSPQIICLNDTTVNCEAIPDPATFTVIAEDNCDPDPEISYRGEVSTQGNDEDLCTAYTYTLTRTWVAKDACGNVSTECVRVISVQDTTAPSIIACPNDTTVNCHAIPDPATFTVIAEDNCNPVPAISYSGEVSTQGNDENLCSAYHYTLTRTWVAKDACGNVSTQCSQVIIVQDTTSPVIIICPNDTTVNCSAIPMPATLSMVADDNCDPDPLISYSGAQSTQGSDLDLCSYYGYTLTRRWVAKDACGNVSAACIQLITVEDVESPVIIACPDDMTVSCNAIPVAATSLLIAVDNCDASPLISYSGEVSTQGNNLELCSYYNYTLTRRWVARDACGNVSTACVQVITVLDNESPTITTCPDDMTVNCNAIPVAATSSVTAVDNCDASPLISYSGEVSTQGNNLELCSYYSYTLTRSWVARDACGNVSMACVQVINVEDTTPPSLSCPADIVIECEESTETQNTGLPTLVEDNCSSVDITYSDESTQGVEGCSVYSYSIIRTWYAADVCGNVTSCIQYIDIVDTTPPVIICAEDVAISCGELLPVSFAGAIDDCDQNVTILGPFDSEPIGICPKVIVRKFYAIDACQNTSSCTQHIYIDDTTPPSITCPPDRVAECGEEINDMATATDVCDSDVFVTLVNDAVVDGNCGYILTRMYRAWDDCGNAASCIQVITVEDTTPPDVLCEDKEVPCDEKICLTFDDIVVNSFADPVLISSVIKGGITIGITAWKKNGEQVSAALYNTIVPHPNDYDLGTPNILYGGAGLNTEAPYSYNYSNNQAVGNAIVVQTPGALVPDDYLLSDSIVFTFSEPVFMESFIGVDFELGQVNTGAGIFLYDVNGASLGFTPFNAAVAENNSLEEVSLRMNRVKKLKVYFGTTVPSSGGVARLCFVHVPEPIALDACSEVQMIYGETMTVSSDCITELQRTFDAVDVCGNENNEACTQIITLETDSHQPDIMCPADINLLCGDPIPAPDPDEVSVTDDCSAQEDIAVEWVEDITEGSACNLVIRRIYRAEDKCGNVALCAQFITRTQEVQLVSKVLLQGPLKSDGTMNTTLRNNNLLPDNQPYNVWPYNYTGAEFVASFPTNIVDWMMLTLLDQNTMSEVATTIALLTSEGHIVALNGVSPVTFNAPPDTYFVAVHHRNHLDIFSDIPVDFTTSMGVMDFTEGNSGSVYLTSLGVYAMRMGDVTKDHLVKYNGSNNDKNAVLTAVGILTPNNVEAGYEKADVNMDGFVKYNGSNNDKNAILTVVGLLTPNNIIQGVFY